MVEQTLTIIDRIIGRINTHPEYSNCVSRRYVRALNDDAKRHSIKLEGKGIRNGNDLNPLDQLNSAENFLSGQGVSLSTLALLGHYVDPEKNPSQNFRRVSSSHPGEIVRIVRNDELLVEPLHASHVLSAVQNLIYYLFNTKDHPAIRAAEAHLELVYIHPYFDGNGRAARLLQSHCLAERGYPVAIIPEAERELYQSLVQDELIAKVEGQNIFGNGRRKDTPFYNLIASKVLASTQALEKELREQRAYEIVLSKVRDHGIVHSIARMLRGAGKTEGKGVKISKNKNKKGTSLIVVGDIGVSEIENHLQSFSNKRKFSYNVKSIGC